jgi:hypothetical protein
MTPPQDHPPSGEIMERRALVARARELIADFRRIDAEMVKTIKEAKEALATRKSARRTSPRQRSSGGFEIGAPMGAAPR